MKKFTTLIFTLFVFQSYAQDRIPVQLTDNQFSVNFFAPTLNYERSISDNQTLNFNFGLFDYAAFSNDDDTEFQLGPSVGVSFRNYYARKKVKKELLPNSGNYFGVTSKYVFGITTNDEIEQSPIIGGVVWGMQRNYQNGFRLGLELGTGLVTGRNVDTGLVPIANFNLGFVINKGKK